MAFAWLACKHVKSNAIVLVQGTATVGVGTGQPNRVDSVIQAAKRAEARVKVPYNFRTNRQLIG